MELILKEIYNMELLKPFAVTGDREDFPVDTDPWWSVEKGYPTTAKREVYREEEFNQMMYLVSKDTVDWKTQTFP